MIDLQQISLELKNRQSCMHKHSCQMIRTFYDSLLDQKEELSPVLTAWKEEFRFIYGELEHNLSSNNKIKPEELVELYGLKDSNVDVITLFMSVQTYFTVLLKTILYQIVKDVRKKRIAAKITKNTVIQILDGTKFEQLGIKDFCHFDFYCWSTLNMTDACYNEYQKLYKMVASYDMGVDCTTWRREQNNDYLKQIYETVIPKQLRHALGEYYTPDWLAEYTIDHMLTLSDEIGKDLRYLDPTCGSGTFLFMTIRKLRSLGVNDANAIVKQVIGYDINPLAILTAKANYLICMLDLIGKGNVSIPVYRYDSLNAPTLQDDSLKIALDIDKEYLIPVRFLRRGTFTKLADVLLQCVIDQDTTLLKETYADSTSEELEALITICNRLGANPTIARQILGVIKDRILGYQEKKVDVVIGNPPWVNWEYLPENYRQMSKHLWKDYGIFTATGRDLSFSKEDISVLVTYAVMDRELKKGGYLAFVIRQAMFKSAQNGVGFRKFRIEGKSSCNLKVLHVDDLSKIRVFDNATNSSAILYMKKNEKTTYPVSYTVWKKEKGDTKPLNSYDSMNAITKRMDFHKLVAMPVNQKDATSLWITAAKEALVSVEKILGSNSYRARTGVFTGGANGVYWVEILKKLPNGNVQVRNITGRAKRKVNDVVMEVEPDLLYPLVQGSDVNPWSIDTKAYIFCPHTKETKMRPMEEDVLEKKYPKTYEYFKAFRKELDERNGFAGWENEMQKEYFYSILRIGAYTFSKYKVVWRYIASEFIVAVMDDVTDEYLGNCPYLPNEKVMYVSMDEEEEAYYLCGILSSTPISFCVKSYMNPTSISTHVLDKLQIPDFDPENALHKQIAALCKQGHGTGNMSEKEDAREQIDELVGKFYGISKEQIQMMKESLKI